MISSQEKQKPVHTEKSGHKNCWRITAAFCLFWYALLGWLRFFYALEFQQYFTELNVWPRPLYIMLSGLTIGIGFSLAVFLTIIKAAITPVFTRIIAMLFLGWLWFDHIWLGTREAFSSQVSVSILITVITLVIIFLFIRNKDYYKENSRKDMHDHQ